LEQDKAIDLAGSAYRDAEDAHRQGDEKAFEFKVGYLNAIMDLAHSEGVHRLKNIVLGLITRLRELRPS
jgi:hypothetical protein